MYTSIKKLLFFNCKRILDFGFTSNLPLLKTLGINDCGELESLDFIKNIKPLIDFRFVGTKIKDGNLNLLTDEKFKFIGFDNKKKYSHNYEELKPLK